MLLKCRNIKQDTILKSSRSQLALACLHFNQLPADQRHASREAQIGSHQSSQLDPDRCGFAGYVCFPNGTHLLCCLFSARTSRCSCWRCRRCSHFPSRPCSTTWNRLLSSNHLPDKNKTYQNEVSTASLVFKTNVALSTYRGELKIMANFCRECQFHAAIEFLAKYTR